ncbi:MAG: STAS domain-containing protein [Actinomycetota bacterium]
MQLDIHTDALHDRTVVRLEGELDAYTAPRLVACFNDLYAKDVTDLVVDLGGVSFIDSTGLGVLVNAYNAAVERDGTVTLVASDPRVVRVLEMTSLDQLFTVHSSLEELGLEE